MNQTAATTSIAAAGAGAETAGTGPFPILLYHSVDDDPPPWIAPFTVSTAMFERQLDLILASGRVAVTARQTVDALRGGRPLPARPVLVTFDDAFQDFVDAALPALRARRLPAALFVTTGALAPENHSLLPPARMMRLESVIAASREGVEIGAHSHTHPQLDTLRPAAVDRELRRSKTILEDALGQAVTLLAYPHGYSDARVRSAAHLAGYAGAFAVRNALSSTRDEPFRVARLTVRSDTGIEQFTHWLRGEGARIAPHRESAQTKLWRGYRTGRARLVSSKSMHHRLE